MRLKKLELLGFKSFADKTEVAFDQGVTCIVGPNGCGKSNVSDSIRWVLGERSAKLLRGSTMEDVIFNGTEVRKPLAFAEVSLTIDNADRGMPIEYNEVTITRRLYRTGESEYLLNKTVCRLKDIQDLILDTGIGSSSYSMIEQGRIDYILKADPEERRFLIEEAAGIAKYKAKKDESIRKLERTEENLKRLNDIVFEVQKNIQYAERQAKRAERYKLELERLKTLEIKRAFYERQKIEQKKQDLTQSFQGKKDGLEALEGKIRSQHDLIAEQESSVRATGQRCHVKEGERYQTLAQIETNDQKLQFIRDKRVELAQQRGQLLQEQDQLRQSLEAATAKKTELAGLLETRKDERSQLETSLAEANRELERHETLVQNAKNVLEAARQEFFNAVQATTHTRNEFHRLKAHGENLASQSRRANAGASRVDEQIAAWNEKLAACLRSLEDINSRLQETLSGHQGLRSTTHAFEHELAELRQQAHDMRLSLREKESRLLTITEMEGGSSAAFQEFLADLSRQSPGLVRDLQQTIKVREGYEWAVDVALGQFARSLVVENAANARSLLEKLTSKKSVVSGILLKKQTSVDPETVRRYASFGFRPISEYAQIELGYEGIFTNIFIRETFPIDSLDAILQLPGGIHLVTRDGLFLDAHGRLFFWSDQNRSQFFFSKKSELEKIRQEIDSLTAQAQEKESKIGFLQTELSALRTQGAEADEQKTETLLTKESLENEKKNIEDRLEAFRKETQLVAEEIANLGRESEQNRFSFDEVRNVLTQKEQAESKLAEIQRQKEKELENALMVREEAMNAVRERQGQAEQFEQGIRHIEESLRLVGEHTQKDQERQAFLAQGHERIAAKEQELDRDEVVCTRLAEEHQQKLRTLDVELEMLRKSQEEQEGLLASRRQDLDEMLRVQKSLQDEEHQISLQQMDLDYQLKNVGERLLQRYRLNLADLNPQDYVFTEEELASAEEVIAGLQNKVDSLGTVNLLAIEEYQELKQRYDFLLAQQKDLDDARGSLMEAIRKINQTTKQLFEDTFKQVQETFKQYYQILFCGGEARLFLIDEAHPLESGIDIVVRPPGKKLQNMSLLSGGEKALTAVALLFALFKIKPSPFCLLDEIDAPLDEANIDRFLTVLRSFIEQSQFIIITHNRKTIAMGDSLYGVTMEEPGVSKIVSVKVRSGEESLPGGNATVRTHEEAVAVDETPEKTTDTVSA
ncbi:MAG TPA: chromosome segregation protein SMC [Candidatus Omnitrophota bacterium]|nr:chromosome segregation protein SMC [Candidatus Omnitrophota bacterium]HRY85217.1 chromosome segregation protein SMC [Candidatus Omnitrophota bacterium]